MSTKGKTILSRVRKKVNTKAAAVMLSAATLVGGGYGIKKYNEHKNNQQRIENCQSMKDGWQKSFPHADEYISDEDQGIYAAVYNIPKDLQKDLAVEYDYVTKTRANIENKLKYFEEVKKHEESLSRLGYDTKIGIKDNKEYQVLSEVIKEMPDISKSVSTFAKHGNAVNKINFYGQIPNFNPGDYAYDCGSTFEIYGYDTFTTFDYRSERRLRGHDIKEESATVYIKNQLEYMTEAMQKVEKKLHKAGLDKYLAEKNDKIKVTQRKVDIYEKPQDKPRSRTGYYGVPSVPRA